MTNIPITRYKQEFIDEYLFYLRKRLDKVVPISAREDEMIAIVAKEHIKGILHLKKDAKLTYEN